MRKRIKKTTAIICASAILSVFAGCNQNSQVITPADTQTSPTQTLTEASTTAVTKNTPVFMLEKLPEIGEYVDDIIYKRRYAETRDTLTPGENYGKLIPFIGSFREYHFVDYETGEWEDGTYSVSKYGLMTDKGEIIVDAVYDYIDAVPCADGDNIIMLSMRGENPDTTGKRLICPSDGSWVIEGNESVCYGDESGIGDIIVTVDHSEVDWENSTGVPKTVFYNRKGQKLVELDNCTPYSHGSFNEGYILLNFYSDYFNGESAIRFVDKKGNVAFEEVQAESDFKNGIACAEKAGFGEGLFSINGKWVVPPIYDGIYKEGDYYFAYNKTHHAVFDENGETIKVISNSELGEKQINFCGERIFYSFNDYSQEEVESYFLDGETGELIYCKETGGRITDYIPETEYFYCDDGAYTYIVDMDGNTIAKLKGAGNINRINDDYFEFVEGHWKDDYQIYNMYSFNGFKKLWSQQIKNTGDRIYIWSREDFVVKTYYPEEEYGEIVTNQTYDILKIETGEPIFENLSDYNSYKTNGEVYYFTGDSTYTYTYAPDMTVLMKVRNERND